MEIELTQISPIAFSMTKKGRWLKIQKVTSRINEYRDVDKIGFPGSAYLVFKGKTKIGMIPRENNHKINTERCQIVGMDKTKNIIIIRI